MGGTMTKRLCFVFVFAALLCAQDPAGRVDALFSSFGSRSPGCALGVVLGGNVFAKAYGMADLEHDVPISAATPFYMASVSKQFTAMSILLLAEDGKIQLGDSIRKYVPALPAYTDMITIRQLLQHTSGVRDYLTLGAIAGFPSDYVFTDESVTRILALQLALNFQPGSENLYSNSGYVLLSLVVKRVTGTNLNGFANERIFGPLGMKSTRFQHDHTATIPGKAFGYQMRGGVWHTANSMLDVVGDGGLYSTVDDMVRWAANYDDPKVGGKAIPIMQKRARLNDGTEIDYGMGLAPGQYRGLRTIEHGGALAGYRTNFLRFPEQHFSVICLCNNGSANPAQLSRQVAQIYLGDQLRDSPNEAAKPATGIAVTPEELKSRPGLYRSEKDGYVEIITRNDKLSMRGPGDLIALGNDRFTAKGAPDGWEIVFLNDALEVRPPHLRAIRFARTRVATLSHQEKAALAGEYESRELGASYRIAVDGGISLEVGDRRFPLRSTGTDRLATEDSGRELIFERDTTGTISGFRLNAGRVRGLEFRRM
jgi:CubicO group peptidase (beta-lactamase class C family)